MPDDFIPWTKKYLPKTLSDIAGHGKAIEQIRNFISKFKKGKALMLYGSSGGGKTSAVYALAHDLGVELVEVNASDSRNADSINELVGNASKQMSLFFKSKLILVDELEGIAGRQDRGGVQAVQKLIESSTYPIILVVNDPYSEKLKSLRKASVLVEFTERPHADISSFLKKICQKEKVDYDEEALSMIARKSGGDMRAAINDLQSLSETNKKISRTDVEELGDRERTEAIIPALIKVFKTTEPGIALGVFDNVNEDLDKIFLWIDENLPKEYTKPADLARGFEALSRADVFKGRIMRWQYYRFYVYCYDLLSAGIALAKDEKYKTMTEYKPTSRILKLWMASQRNMKKKAISEKIGEKTHTSRKRAMQDTLPYLRAVFRNNKKEGERLSEFLDLDREQIEWLSNQA
ncbi:replication factor C large subunit [Candidatus Woesearchaeota archaeon]|nr:replication factor C large subunit [Candidatus Woesearchaeota archaeon]